jgi:phosphoribosylanthranilate isomerase
MILSPRGPRALDLERAVAVRRAIPAGVLAVGVVVDESRERLATLARELGLDLLQLHGAETPESLNTLEVPWLKTIGVDASSAGPVDVARVRAYAKAWGVLFDSSVRGETGGTGRAFPWTVFASEELRAAVPQGRLVLAGGLVPENVGRAIAAARPFAVDVASGVESSPGVKDRVRLERFFASASRSESAA